LAAGGFEILNRPRGNVQTQKMGHFRGTWSNDNHLWWTGAKLKDRLEIAVPIERAGRYAVRVVLTKARDYGIVRMSLGGQPASEPIDLYNPDVVNTDPIPLGDFQLDAGQAKLVVEIVGANDKAVPAYMFGLDQVLVEPLE
jgi:hypothetical protein